MDYQAETLQEINLADRISQHQAKSEKLFAAAVMIDADYARQSCGWLEPKKFVTSGLRKYWQLVRDGKEPNEAAMEAQVFSEVVGGMIEVPSSFYTPAYANAIAQDYYLRESSTVLGDMARAIGARDLETLKHGANSIAQNSPVGGDEVQSAVDIGMDFIATLEDITGQSELTGIKNVDDATGGIEKSSMTIIAARPSMGKSTLGIQLCRYKAEKEKKNAMLFSLEMKKRNVWARMACGDLKIAWRDVRAGRVSPEKIQEIKDKSSELMNKLEDRFRVDDRSNLSMEDIWRVVSRYQPDFVVIDHLGLIRSDIQDEVKALGAVSWTGKMLAKQFDIPVIFLYQLNRASEKENRIPRMSDLRGSGKIEENADNILFLHRPDYFEDAKTNQAASNVSDAQLIVSKFREGVRNIEINLMYQLDEQKFYPPARPKF